LFGILIDWISKKACDGYGLQLERRTHTLRGNKEGWKLPHFDFAYDVALLTSGERQATEALARLETPGEEVGLVVSPGKTKAMTVGTVPINLSNEGQPCPENELRKTTP
jgi:hypothetical protein